MQNIVKNLKLLLIKIINSDADMKETKKIEL